MTIDRRSVRDIGFAVLLALPTAALMRPAASGAQHHPAAAASHLQLALANEPALQQRFGLPG